VQKVEGEDEEAGAEDGEGVCGFLMSPRLMRHLPFDWCSIWVLDSELTFASFSHRSPNMLYLSIEVAHERMTEVPFVNVGSVTCMLNRFERIGRDRVHL